MSPFVQLCEPARPDRAFVFPGQGSQAVGMGKELYEQFPSAREVYDRADAILGFGLSRLCFDGPEADLVQTRNAQPAIAVTSLALLRVVAEVAPQVLERPAYMAGHSLGEYAALIGAGALAFDDGVRLLRLRGELMQAAGDRNPGTMAAVLGLDAAACEQVCRETGTEISTDNAPGQIVVGGPHEAVARAMDLARERGAARVVQLSVSGAFHTSLMQPAADGMTEAIHAVAIHDPLPPIIANCTATPVADADAVRNELISQITQTVRWSPTVEFLAAQGVQTFIEIGPGHVLSAIIKRMQRTARVVTINDSASVQVQL